MVRFLCRIVLLCAAFSGAVSAQQAPTRRLPGAISPEEATLLVNGYASLAQGDYGKALEKAIDARSRFPRSAAVLALSIDVEIARNGAKAGLDAYEGWLRGRALEEPALLRTIAIASLREFAAPTQTKDGLARDAALWVLVDDGDAEAYKQVFQSAMNVETGAIRRLAARGDVGAINSLLPILATRTPNAQETIKSLGESRHPSVVEPIARKLTDPEPGVRAAAAEAVGKAGGPAVISRLKPLLSDANGAVKAEAAGALFRLNDLSGIAILRELAESEVAAGRVRAAELMASRPDGAWLSMVRGLLEVPDPDIRLRAARLLIEHDRALAASALERLSSDANPVMREEATRLMASDLHAPLATLRRLMRHPDWLTRVNAAGTIATLTR